MASKVLVIDDSALVRHQVARALAAAGFGIIEATDGIDGLAKLEANTDVALVLCDVTMPRMNGIEFLENMPPSCSVVMLTTEGRPEVMQRAKALGAKGWIIKPFKPELLIASVRKLVM
ncbi:MAG TPA: response regulator [Kofleriaceae bacterium]|nr:response regulator [Kofleriaceae bacterium]